MAVDVRRAYFAAGVISIGGLWVWWRRHSTRHASSTAVARGLQGLIGDTPLMELRTVRAPAMRLSPFLHPVHSRMLPTLYTHHWCSPVLTLSKPCAACSADPPPSVHDAWFSKRSRGSELVASSARSPAHSPAGFTRLLTAGRR
jgi:hypothetical protein